MKISEIISTNTIKLSDLYDDSELNDETEAIYNFIDKDDLNREFVVHTMTPEQAKSVKTHRGDTTVYQSYKDFASDDAKQLIRDKISMWDTDRIIVLMNDTLLDGNHQLIAGIEKKEPVKYIDLAEYNN